MCAHHRMCSSVGMRWMAVRLGWSFHEKCVCASVMPGISVAPRASTDLRAGRGQRARAAAHARDAVALHEHFAGVRLRAGAVEDAHVGEEHVGHGQFRSHCVVSAPDSRARRCRRSRCAPCRRASGTCGGLKPMPTPAGVPVAITSPGFSVMPVEIVAISVRNAEDEIARRRVLAQFVVDPAAHARVPAVELVRRSTMHGPIGPKVSNDLPSSHCRWRVCTSRAVTSLKIV